MRTLLSFVLPALLLVDQSYSQETVRKAPQVSVVNGILEGTLETSGIRSFKGIPFAQPPVGDLRFREPQPPKNWEGVRKATAFGPRAMQLPIYSDMNFRSNGVSEDCLYLNVWTPARSAQERLPVLVYFYGGGFSAGDGSEYRYDGESLARRGIVTVTVNYRVGIFGFFAHPDLTRESPHHSSGNYAFFDQHAALVWVQKNIAAFGGDPGRVTIGGQSAGSSSVSAQVASPLSKGLFRGAIGESGSLFGNNGTVSLAEAEKNGAAFAGGLGNKTLADLRALPAEELLAAAKSARFTTAIDGYFLPAPFTEIFGAGKQMPVALLAGWTSAEQDYRSLLGKEEPTVENYEKAVRRSFPDKAEELLKLYPAGSTEEVKRAGTDMATDRGAGYRTGKWIDLHSRTSGRPVYRYLYTHLRPKAAGESDAGQVKAMGAGHSWEIEYALGNLQTNKVYAWTPEDERVSETLESYFANFIKTEDPNGGGLPRWPPVKSGSPDYMLIDVISHAADRAEADKAALRLKFWDASYQGAKK